MLAIGAHPDDVEIGCGGILALCAQRGLKVGLLHLTRGEAGTRGSAEQRAAEAAAAAVALGAEHRILDCGDGGLRTSREEEDQVIQALREARPRCVLLPPAHDRHPDHERAQRLARSACFYAGLMKRPDPAGLEPHRPQLQLSYLLHRQPEPTLVVDIGSVVDRKIAALRCYASQLTLPDAEPSEERETWVSSATFGHAVLARSRHYGAQIGVEHGEPLLSEGPLPLLAIGEILGAARNESGPEGSF
ncbi:MAG: bacillithiol biosynthesis deacetylase BshB1 [Acidobacteriota bacterium]